MYSPYGYTSGYGIQGAQFSPFASALGNYQQMQAQLPAEAQITVAQVPTVDHVEQVQMRPGERKIILVQNDPNFLAIRVADTAGFVTTEYRTSQVIDPKSATQQIQYASVHAVMELKKEVDGLREMIEKGVVDNGSKPVDGFFTGEK